MSRDTHRRKLLGKLFGTLKELGFEFDTGSRILDFGCGNGEEVLYLNQQGFQGAGCDVKFKEGPHVQALSDSGTIRHISLDPYQLPFEDDLFDLVYSMQVFEHVQNYQESLAEIHRVLKPGGVSLHFFPSRYRPIETHVRVPFASVFQNYWWLLFWAKLGIRKESQKNMSAKETAQRNFDYLTSSTTYYTKQQIANYVKLYFDEYQFCELVAAKYSRLRTIFPVLRITPFASQFLSAYQTRALFFRKQDEAQRVTARLECYSNAGSAP